jgi:hypothetical protein
MLRKLQKRSIFLAVGADNTDGVNPLSREAQDGASRAAKLALKRLYLLRREAKMLLKKSLENFHDRRFRHLLTLLHNDTQRTGPESNPRTVEPNASPCL